MTRIVLTRHGETVWHAENRYTGSSDIALTETGRRQAAALGRWAREVTFDQVWSSDLTRSQQTAEPAARALGLPLRIDARLRELDFGHAEGRTLSDLRAQFPGEVDEFLADPADNPLPGGESPADAVARARTALHEIAAQCPDTTACPDPTAQTPGRVLVVMHSTLLRLLLCDLIGVPLGRYRSLLPVVHNVALTELDWRAGEVALVHYNAPLPVPDDDADAVGAPVAHQVRSQNR